MRDYIINKTLVVSGTFFLVLGIIGIFIPILPATPFLLLATACYARGSKRFYNWLMNNKWLGIYVKNYLEGRGIPLPFKILTITLLWITIVFSTIVIVSNYLIKMILIIIAIAVTIHILTIKTMKKGIKKQICKSISNSKKCYYFSVNVSSNHVPSFIVKTLTHHF
jgi:uncharacterized membrane protein YbaN (DUF454 family)